MAIKNEITIRTSTTYTDIDLSEGLVANENGYIAVSLTARAPVTFSSDVTADCYSPGLSSAVIALYHNPEFTQPYVGIPEYDGPEPEVRLWPNPATDKITIESEEEFPVNDVRCTLNVHNLAPGTYIAHVETKAGMVDRKFIVRK